MVPPRTRKTSPAKKATGKKAAVKKASGSKPGAPETQPDGELAEGDGRVRTGLITRTGLIDAPVQFEARDGLAIFEGDIILGTVEELENGVTAAAEIARDFTVGLHAGVAAGTVVDVVPPEGDDPMLTDSIIIPGANFRWPQGRVPFETAANLTQAARDALTRAVTHWHDNTRLSFRARRQGDTAWLTCQDSTQCSSAVGRQGGQQAVNLSTNAVSAQPSTSSVMQSACGTSRAARTATRLSGSTGPTSSPGSRTTSTSTSPTGTTSAATTTARSCTTAPLPSASSTRHRRAGVTIAPTQPLPPASSWASGEARVSATGPPSRRCTRALSKRQEHLDWPLRRGCTRAAALLRPGPECMVPRRDVHRCPDLHRVGDTSGFGDLNDGRPFWVGDFTGDGSTDVLFYYPGDDNWWLGDRWSTATRVGTGR